MPRITFAALITLMLCVPVSGQQRLAGEPVQPRRAQRVSDPLGGTRREGSIAIPPPKPGGRRVPGARGAPPTTGHTAVVVVSSLAIVLGLFFLIVWVSRRAFPKASVSLSTEVLEIVGRSPLAHRHQLQLIRLGRRLLLVSVTPEHAETLTEITDPDEVNHLTSLCRQQQAGSISDSFRQVLHQLGAPSTAPSRKAGSNLDDLELTNSGNHLRG
ncbi:MAG: flagellar biosynthetic protein FliO [Pirellulaceae bacterium]